MFIIGTALPPNPNEMLYHVVLELAEDSIHGLSLLLVKHSDREYAVALNNYIVSVQYNKEDALRTFAENIIMVVNKHTASQYLLMKG